MDFASSFPTPNPQFSFCSRGSAEKQTLQFICIIITQQRKHKRTPPSSEAPPHERSSGIKRDLLHEPLCWGKNESLAGLSDALAKHARASTSCNSLQLLFPPLTSVMLENTANMFSDGLQTQPLLSSQENVGSEHKCILNMASGCVTCLHRPRSAYSGPRIPRVKEILASPESNEDRFDRKIDLLKPWICTSCEENIHRALSRYEISTVWNMGHLLWENKSASSINLLATSELYSFIINWVEDVLIAFLLLLLISF